MVSLPCSNEVIAKQLYDVIGKRTLHTCTDPVEATAKQLYDVIGKRTLHTCTDPVEATAKQLCDVIGKLCIYEIYIIIYNTISHCSKVHVLILYSNT